ncbi:hypothetical protein C8J56DRAFT_923276 [Mycena floridula]|nr:hypothetical protein C8J56DRAFT_923276 [Mycena floridula]
MEEAPSPIIESQYNQRVDVTADNKIFHIDHGGTFTGPRASSLASIPKSRRQSLSRQPRRQRNSLLLRDKILEESALAEGAAPDANAGHSLETIFQRLKDEGVQPVLNDEIRLSLEKLLAVQVQSTASSVKPSQSLNVDRIIAKDSVGDIASGNILIAGDFNVHYPSQPQALARRDLGADEKEDPGGEGDLPDTDAVDKRLDEAIALALVVSDEIECFLEDIHSRSRYNKTDPSIEQCSSFVSESIIWADRGVDCALHNANDICRALENGETSTQIVGRLGKWEREAAEGGRRALKFQIGFPGINSLQNVTGWWDEMAKSLSQTRQGVDSRKDSTEPIANLMYLGERFRAYSSQLRELQDLYPAPAASLIATMSKHFRIIVAWPFSAP